MALIAPVLDNRTYEQLRDELVGRIPSVAPEWTNHNESDPGIALLELFAHLGESLLYRFNQIPETTKIAFLQLLGVRPRPAQPAHALLAARTDRPTGVQALKATEAPAGSVLFETDDEVFIWPLDVVAAGKTPDPPHKLSKQEKESRDDALARFSPPVHPDDAQFYHTSVLPADPLAPDATSLDVSAQVDQSLWIGLVAKPTTDVTALPNQTVFIGVAFDETIDPPLVLENLDAAGAATYGSANLTRDPPAMTWQIWNGPNPTGRPFTTLAVIGDTTRGLLTSGVVKVVLPPRLPVITGTTDGGQDSPPPLDDSELAAKVIAWLRVSRPPTAQLGDAIGRVRWVGINAVGATQARTATAELLGSGTGDADQQYPLSHRPVLPGTVVLEVEEAAGWVRWTEVDNFAWTASTPPGSPAPLPPNAPTPSIRTPGWSASARSRCRRSASGSASSATATAGARRATWRAGAITSLTGLGGVEVGNPLPAVGGADAADVTEALDAIPAIVHRHDRAVIAADFESAGRARWPGCPGRHPGPDAPGQPDRRGRRGGQRGGLRAGRRRHGARAAARPRPAAPGGPLPRRPAAGHHRALRDPAGVRRDPVAVGLQVRAGYQADAVRRWVDQILRHYLAPLPTGGPDGEGWPLGRDVRRAELEAVAVQVEGVEYLEDLRLGRVLAGGIDEDDLIELEKWQVPAVVGLTVSIGPALEPGVGRGADAAGPDPGAAAGRGLLMAGDRGISILAHPDQWAHCRHDQTALLPGGGVQLTWTEAGPAEACAGAAAPRASRRAGLRPVVHGLPVPAGVRAPVTAVPAGQPAGPPASPVRTTGRAASPSTRPGGSTSPTPVPAASWSRPGAAAGAAPARPGSGPSGRPGRALRPGAGPDHRRTRRARRLGCSGWRAAAGRAPAPPLVRPRCPGRLRPTRLAAGPLVLWTGRAGAVVARPDGTRRAGARRRHRPRRRAGRSPGRRPAPGRQLPPLRAGGGGRTDGWLELEPVGAPGYDGGAIAHTPAGRIAFTTATGAGHDDRRRGRPRRRGFGHQLPAGQRHATGPAGAGCSWTPACPRGRRSPPRFLTTDEDTVPDPIDPAPPARPLLAGRPAAGERPALPAAAVGERCSSAGGSSRGGLPAAHRPGGQLDRPTRRTTPSRPRCTRRPAATCGCQLKLRGTDQATPAARGPDRAARPPAAEQPAPELVAGRGGRRVPAALPGPGRGNAARAGLARGEAGRAARPAGHSGRQAGLAGQLRRAGAGPALARARPAAAGRRGVPAVRPARHQGRAAPAARALPRPAADHRRAVAAPRARRRRAGPASRPARRRPWSEGRPARPGASAGSPWAAGSPTPTPIASPRTAARCWCPVG